VRAAIAIGWGVKSVVPPTPRDDGTPRAWVGDDFLPVPEELLADLARHSAPALELARRREEEARRASSVEPLDREELRGLTPLERFTYALDEAGHRYERTSSGSYSCRCTSEDHPDRSPSMTFGEVEPEGKLTVTCWSRQCTLEDIMGGVGLRESDAYPERYASPRPSGRPRRPGGPSRVPSVERISDEEAWAWAEEQAGYEDALGSEPASRLALAERLGLPIESLDAVRFGLRRSNRHREEGGEWVDLGPAWTWPERDERGRVVGICRRFVDPAVEPKKRLIGSRRDDEERPDRVTHRAARGLVYPDDFARRDGPVVVVEGESDVLALCWLGYAAVGRPGARGGLDLLAGLLGDDERDVVVLGENDERADGSWPGDPAPLASELARRLGRQVKTLLPPAGLKDAREWVASLPEGGRP
jgi:hypothetical protein